MVFKDAIYHHGPKNVLLLVLSILLLPLDTAIVGLALISNYIRDLLHGRRIPVHPILDKRKTILVTGVGMSKGLVLARAFFEQGHRVIGADFDRFACGSVSRSLSKYQVLPKPDGKTGSSRYISGLLGLIQQKRIDLWVSCSAVASALDDAEAKEIVEARTSCRAIQFNVATTERLHEKHKFMEYCQKIGLTVPETIPITSPATLTDALRNAPHGRKYIMKPIGVDDANRADMTLLPKTSRKETEDYISRLKISKASPWILQQYIRGAEYCTHSVVINGRVKAFVACPSAELLMHYEALPSDSKLSQAMLDFTKHLAERSGPGFTGHLSFDFMVEESASNDASGKGNFELYPIECNPRAHTANVLFYGTPDMTKAYLSLLEDRFKDTKGSNMLENNSITVPQTVNRYFWVVHDLVELLIMPTFHLLGTHPIISLAQWAQNILMFLSHLVYWHDGTFQWRDPAPFWVLYHVYWPMQFWKALRTGKHWSRLNVSTTKMFAC